MADLEAEAGLSRRTLDLILEDLSRRAWVKELEPQSAEPRPADRRGHTRCVLTCHRTTRVARTAETTKGMFCG